MSKLGIQALAALKAKYNAEIDYHEANLAVYLTNMVGIGEHSDLLAEIDVMLGKITDLRGKIDVIANATSNDSTVLTS